LERSIRGKEGRSVIAYTRAGLRKIFEELHVPDQPSAYEPAVMIAGDIETTDTNARVFALNSPDNFKRIF